MLNFVERASNPGTPDSGRGRLYYKSDKFLYFIDDAGSVNPLAFGTIPTNYVTTDTTQTGLAGNKSWTGNHDWNATSGASIATHVMNPGGSTLTAENATNYTSLVENNGSFAVTSYAKSDSDAYSLILATPTVAVLQKRGATGSGALTDFALSSSKLEGRQLSSATSYVKHTLETAKATTRADDTLTGEYSYSEVSKSNFKAYSYNGAVYSFLDVADTGAQIQSWGATGNGAFSLYPTSFSLYADVGLGGTSSLTSPILDLFGLTGGASARVILDGTAGVITLNASSSVIIPSGIISSNTAPTASSNSFLYRDNSTGLIYGYNGPFVGMVNGKNGSGIANGAITLTTSDIGEGTNLYFTEARVLNTTMATVGTPNYKSVQQMQDIFHSSGWTLGGVITDAGGGTVDVSAGEGFIRATASSLATLNFFSWSASSGITIPLNTIKEIGVEYNAGTPQIVMHDDGYLWDNLTEFVIGSVTNDGGVLYINQEEHAVADHAGKMISRAYETTPIARDVVHGGLIIGETGTRNLVLTAGALWLKLRRYPIASINTATGDTFEAYYNRSAYTDVGHTADTQWDNLYYDNAGTLTALSTNKYGVHWVYVNIDGQLMLIYGTQNANTLALAQAEPPPTTLPLHYRHSEAMLVGQIAFQQGASTGTFRSAFTTTFPAGQAQTSTLQQAYNNSTTPEITTDDTRGALTLKQGTALATAKQIEILNSSSVEQFSVTAEGKIYAPNLPAGTIASGKNIGIDASGNLVTATISTPTNYITTDSTQTGLTGDKTSTGAWSLGVMTLGKAGTYNNFGNNLSDTSLFYAVASAGYRNHASFWTASLSNLGVFNASDSNMWLAFANPGTDPTVTPSASQVLNINCFTDFKAIPKVNGTYLVDKNTTSITLASGTNLTVAVTAFACTTSSGVLVNPTSAVASFVINNVQALSGQFIISYSSGYAGSLGITYTLY